MQKILQVQEQANDDPSESGNDLFFDDDFIIRFLLDGDDYEWNILVMEKNTEGSEYYNQAEFYTEWYENYYSHLIARLDKFVTMKENRESEKGYYSNLNSEQREEYENEEAYYLRVLELREQVMRFKLFDLPTMQRYRRELELKFEKYKLSIRKLTEKKKSSFKQLILKVKKLKCKFYLHKSQNSNLENDKSSCRPLLSMFKKHKPKFYVNKILSSNLKVNESVSENDLNNNEIRIESSDFNEREALPENSSSKKDHLVNKDSKFNQIKVEECGSKRFLRTRDTQGPLKKRRLNGYVFNQINKPVQLKRLMYNENELSKSQNEQSDILQTSMDSYSINECKSTNKTLSTCVKLTTKIKYNKHYILFRDLLRTFKNSTVIDQHVNNKESEMINSTIQFPESATFTFYPRNVVKKKEKSVRFDIGSDIYDIKNVSEELKKIEHALAPQRSVSFSSKVVVHEVENVSEELQNIRYVNITMLVTKYLADIYPFDPETDTTGNPKGLGTIRDFISWCPDYFDGKLRYYNEDHSTQNSESQTKLDMSTPIFRDPIFWSSDPNYGQNKMKISRPIIPASFISEYTANDSNYSFNENIYVPSISVSTNNGSVNESNDFPNQSSSTPNSSSESSNKNVSSNEGSQLRRQPHNFERGRILDYKPNCPVTAEVNYFRMKYGRVTYPLFKW